MFTVVFFIDFLLLSFIKNGFVAPYQETAPETITFLDIYLWMEINLV